MANVIHFLDFLDIQISLFLPILFFCLNVSLLRVLSMHLGFKSVVERVCFLSLREKGTRNMEILIISRIESICPFEFLYSA